MIEYSVVIPVGPNRRENLTAVMRSIGAQTRPPSLVVLVCDGEDAWMSGVTIPGIEVVIVRSVKHRPGMTQPRNIGARTVDKLRRIVPEKFGRISFVAFLDTDVVVKPDWWAEYQFEIMHGGREGLYYGPYEFLPQGFPPFNEDDRFDTRWPMFRSHKPGTRYVGDLAKGLGAYSGNLVWNLDDFIRVGGFWNDIHHGRCEDGELGLRAVHMGVPIGLVPKARGWHRWHPINYAWVTETNAIDVPKLKERHPWLELGQGGTEVFMVDEDGRRFNARCECGWEGNTALLFGHQDECELEAA